MDQTRLWAGESCLEVSPDGRQYWGEPDITAGDLAARQVLVDLTGDVALQDADDLVLGPSLLDAAIEVGAEVLVSWAMRTMTMRHRALLA